MKPYLLLLSLALLPQLAFSSAKCWYCPDLNQLQQGFRAVEPDALNEKTIDRQNALVDATIDLILRVVEKSKELAPKELESIVGIMAIANLYDYQNLMADSVLSVLTPKQAERLFAEITRQEKSGMLTPKQADELRIAMGTAEGVKEYGSDPEAPAVDEVRGQ